MADAKNPEGTITLGQKPPNVTNHVKNAPGGPLTDATTDIYFHVIVDEGYQVLTLVLIDSL